MSWKTNKQNPQVLGFLPRPNLQDFTYHRREIDLFFLPPNACLGTSFPENPVWDSLHVSPAVIHTEWQQGLALLFSF